jgi:dephospho-CoA kinase
LSIPFAPRRPLVIGLLGGIASGKSTVAAMFGEHGLVVIDADRIARQVLEEPEVRARLRARFAPAFAAGGLDRQHLARIAFDDPAARADLEAITHPPIRSAILRQLEQALANGRSVVLDAPLLAEGGLLARCDAAVFVQTSDAKRLARAAERGWDEAELRRREAAQASLGMKKSKATATIDNDRAPEDVRRQVAELLARLEAHPERPGR